MCEQEKREGRKKGSQRLEELIYRVIGCMIEVHKELGPGFLENVCRRAMEIEFAQVRSYLKAVNQPLGYR